MGVVVVEVEAEVEVVEHLVDNTCLGSFLNRKYLYRSYNNHRGLQNLEGKHLWFLPVVGNLTLCLLDH